MTRAEKTISELLDEGWHFDHEALVCRYRFAGTITAMQTRKGFEYCRVHHGKSVGKHSWQITTVLSRRV